ncbi:glycine C-acetyltransferase [Armatimonas rosea]|uniref:8-amino-7-ketopelargonate synthase n=1 Tax=Armatimonas rosea TaxID=685828 RepID=A0A7W9SSI0_ARMRO|nr:glycine C-acetyltransferase [Armatimonas rosea]MBB6051565.1 glycine C-acetyltransferase [Armatimonas rosea]
MNNTLQDFLKGQLDTLHAEHLYKPLTTVTSAVGARVKIAGNDRELINLSSNNYLGLAGDPRLRQAASEAALAIGAGGGAVRPIIGNLQLHDDLEKLIASFKHVEDVLVFQSGFTANAGTIPTITDADDAIITDSLNHASIIDGCRLSKAKRAIYQHCDMDSLEEALKAAMGAKKRLVITDGVFSMDGDVAPLDQICALAERYDAAVMVDDAHGSGVMGANGRGTAYHFGVHQKIDIQLGTLSKAVGVVGGYIAGSSALIDFLKQRARPFLFSTGCPPAVAAACIKGIELMRDEPELSARLWANTKYWQEGLQKLGFDTGVTQTPITPVMIGDEAKTQEAQRLLRDEGILALAIVFPTVGRGKARLRTMPTAAHTQADFDEALAAFERVGKKLGLI